MASPIFLLGSGRSGSTLLQRLLNSYDDITIWGEHSGFLTEVADSFFKLFESQGSREFLFPGTAGKPLRTLGDLQERKLPSTWQAWINGFTPEEAVDNYRQMVESFFRHPLMGDDHRWGFKEIRYGADDRVIEFLARLYPDALFVFLSRHGFDTIASQMKAFHFNRRLHRIFPSPTLWQQSRVWGRQNEALLRWHQSGKIQSQWLTFEEISTNAAALQPLLAAIGKDFGPAQRAILDMEEGRGSAYVDKSNLDKRWKSLGYLSLLAADWAMGGVNDQLGYQSPASIGWFSSLRRMFGKSKPQVSTPRAAQPSGAS